MLKAATALICFAAMTSLATTLAPAAAAQDARPHAESCAVVGYLQPFNFNIGAVNTCAESIEVWILTADGNARSGRIAHDQSYDSGVPREQGEQGWVWAACPAGYQPSVSVTEQNRDAIEASHYQCVRR